MTTKEHLTILKALIIYGMSFKKR